MEPDKTSKGETSQQHGLDKARHGLTGPTGSKGETSQQHGAERASKGLTGPTGSHGMTSQEFADYRARQGLTGPKKTSRTFEERYAAQEAERKAKFAQEIKSGGFEFVIGENGEVIRQSKPVTIDNFVAVLLELCPEPLKTLFQLEHITAETDCRNLVAGLDFSEGGARGVWQNAVGGIRNVYVAGKRKELPEKPVTPPTNAWCLRVPFDGSELSWEDRDMTEDMPDDVEYFDDGNTFGDVHVLRD